MFGKYTMYVMVQTNMFFEIFLCTALFCWYFKRRKYFWLWLSLCFFGGIGVMLVLAVIRTATDNAIAVQFLSALVMGGVMLGTLFACFREDISEILLCWCGGIAAFQATGAIVGIIFALAGIDDHTTISFFQDPNSTRDWIIYYLLHVSLYVIFSFVFSRKKLRGSANSIKYTVVLSVFTVMFMIIVSTLSRAYEGDDLKSRAVTKILIATLYLLVLILRTGIFTQSKYKQDLKIMDELMREEKKQFESMRTNIDVINMKCHDLKHRLSDLEGKLTETELAELKAAIEIYDTSLKTGNDILDVVIYEKSLVCERGHIKLTCMADGAALSFMNSAHVYSMFANAIDNAIEAVSELDESKRAVSIVVAQKSGITEITVTNRFAGERKIEDGKVNTTKSDKARHGYGLKSIRYIASLYDGKVNVSAADGIFYLQILLPPPR